MASSRVSGEAIIAIEWLLLAISGIAIIARLYLRLKINRRKLVASDVCICLAWCAAMVTIAFDIVFFQMGILNPNVDALLKGYHGDKKSLRKALKYFWVSNTPFFCCFYLSKATLLAFYWQITPDFMRGRRYFLYGIIVYCVVAFTSTMLLNLFLCFPIKRNWAIGPDACFGPQGIVFQTAWGFNFLGDLLVFILPFTFLHTLKISGAVRVGVYCIFGLGIVNMAFSLTRLLSIKLAPHNANNAAPFTIVELWSVLDMIIGVLIANLPSLRPYLRMIRTRRYEPAPKVPTQKPIHRKVFDKYNHGPKEEETTGSTLQDSDWVDEGGKKSLKVELQDSGVLITKDDCKVRSEEVGQDFEMLESKGSASPK
ncbi:hypothetical protein GQ44DRAFT_773544 [Phaeosphaeriaceae sp. PMI808]|nr:hypothetical protein GQ44DRAFT_773544 [Phaeosphaeriaceae sp. PMI808]